MSGYKRVSQSSFSEADWKCFEDAWKGVRKGKSKRDRDWFVDWHKKRMDAVHSGRGPTSALFLPWHRKFVLEFEKNLRQIEPNVTIPFWNATEKRDLPDALKKKFFGWMKSGARSTGSSSSLPRRSELDTLMKIDDYLEFSGTLEGGYHGRVHNWVGGVMGDVSKSPKDPLFWLHHCMVDRIWAAWQSIHPNASHPTPDDKLGPWSKVKVRDVLDLDDLQYRYQNLEALASRS